MLSICVHVCMCVCIFLTLATTEWLTQNKLSWIRTHLENILTLPTETHTHTHTHMDPHTQQSREFKNHCFRVCLAVWFLHSSITSYSFSLFLISICFMSCLHLLYTYCPRAGPLHLSPGNCKVSCLDPFFSPSFLPSSLGSFLYQTSLPHPVHSCHSKKILL